MFGCWVGFGQLVKIKSAVKALACVPAAFCLVFFCSLIIGRVVFYGEGYRFTAARNLRFRRRKLSASTELNMNQMFI
jgi:hypothetical protein